MLITAEVICALAPTAPAWIATEMDASLSMAAATTPLRAAMYAAQLAEESAGFSRFEENLSYSAAGLLATWPLHFDAAAAQSYQHQPERIANRAYAGRLGNGDEQSGDGWKFRGRGAIQLTGFDAYLACGRYLGLDLIGRPDLALQHIFEVAAWFWRKNGLNAFADAADVVGATKRINGGQLGLAARQALYAKACAALGVS